MSAKKKYPAGYDAFWGDGGPYSLVNLTREVRIIDDEISREFFLIQAQINPGTYDLLKKGRKKLDQPVVGEFLENAEFIDLEVGYRWNLYYHEVIGNEDFENLKKIAVNKVIALHRIIMSLSS